MLQLISVAFTTVLNGEKVVGIAPTGTFHAHFQVPTDPSNENLPETILLKVLNTYINIYPPLLTTW